MQASLKDLDLTRHDTQSFIICQRTLLKCHEIIFGDLPPPAPTPYATLNLPIRWRFTRRKVRHHPEPALVGLGVILAGAPGMPQLTEIMGEVAIEQGRMDEEGHGFKGLEIQGGDVVPDVTISPTNESIEDNGNDSEASQEDLVISPMENTRAQTANFVSDNTDVIGSKSLEKGSLTRRRTIGAAQTAPALSLHLRALRRSRLSEDPLGQLDPDTPIHAPTPYQSSPSISSSKPPPPSRTFNLAEALLEKYDLQSQVHLLRSQYCRTEVC